MSSNLRFKIDFPTWFVLSPELKTLMTIFMENAIIAFTGYTEDQTYIQGVMFMDKVKIKEENVYNYVNEYTEYYGLSKYLYDLVALMWDNSSSEYNEIYFNLGIPTTDISLTKVSSGIRMCQAYSSEFDIYSSGTFIPITITPMINGVENTNPNRVPVFIANGELNEDGYCITQVKADTSSFTPTYTFHLRTSSFTIKYYSEALDDYVERDVFYKVGINIFDTNFTLSDILNELSGHKLELSSEHATGYSVQYLRLTHPDYPNISFTDNANEKIAVAQHRYSWGSLNYLTESLIAQLYFFSGYGDIIGWIYMKLYNEDGTVFNHTVNDPDDIPLYEIGYRSSEGGSITYPSSLPLLFTDQSMNGGFVETVIPSGD